MKTNLLRRWLAVFLLLCLVSPSWGTLSASVVWEARASGASDNNGGGFVAGASGTDYSQQNAAQLTLTDLATTGVVTTLTSVTGGFTAQMVGDIIHIVSGTNFTAGFYQITVFTNSNTVTLDRAPTTAAGVGGTGSVGGALATLGTLSGAMVASNKAFVTGAFTSTTTTTFAQTVTPAAGTAPTDITGYGVTRGDGTHATLTLSGAGTITGVLASGLGFFIKQLDVDCGSITASTAFQIKGDSRLYQCKANNFTTDGVIITGGNFNSVEECEITGGTSAATSGAISIGTASSNLVARCYIHDNVCPGIVTAADVRIISNLITNNTGASSDGIRCIDQALIFSNTIHGNGRHGIFHNATADYANAWLNNILTNNGGYGISGSSGTALPARATYDGNVYGGGASANTSGARNLMDSVTGIYGVNPYTNVRDVTLSVSPYVGPTSGGTANFALNDVPGGGQACRRAGSPGTFPGLATTVGYLDMGAVQTRSNIRIPRAAPRPMPKAKPVLKPKKKAVH